MRNFTTTLESFTNFTEFELLEVSRRKQYKDGESTDYFDTVYKVLINYEPIEIRVSDDGAIAEKTDTINSYRQLGEPLLISFENCQITVTPKSQYELLIRGTAQRAFLTDSE